MISTLYKIICLVLLGLSLTADRLFPADVPTFAPGVRTVPVAARDLKFSSARNLLYVAVPAYAKERANTVTVVSPSTGAILGSTPIPGDPTVLAMSGDQKYLYVGTREGDICRIDLDTRQADQTFSTIQTGVAEPRWVAEIEVFPDRPESIVAAVGHKGVTPLSGCAIAVFDNGVMRPRVVPPGTGMMKLTFGADPQTLWSYNSDSTAFDFYRLTVSADGISAARQDGGMFTAFNIDPLFHDGLVIAKGYVFDPVTRIPAGRFYSVETVFASSVALDGQSSRIYFANRSGYDFTLAEFDLTTYRLTGYFDSALGGGVPVPWDPVATVTCGDSGIAMGNFEGDAQYQWITIFPRSLLLRPVHWTPPAPRPMNDQIRRIPLENNGIAADVSRGRIYASLSNWSYDIGNSVVTIDAVQGTVSNPVWVGADPWQMAVSAQDKYLYVALYNGWAVQRLRLPELVPDLRIPMVTEPDPVWGTGYARVNQLVPFPDAPESFAIARAGAPGDEEDVVPLGVAVYDGDRKRPKGTPGGSWLERVTSIQWSKTGASLLGFPAFREFSVTPEGVDVAWATPGVTQLQKPLDLMACQYGVCFTPGGHIIDGAAQERVGEFQFDFSSTDFGWPDAVIPDLDRGLIYFLSYAEYAPTRRLVVEAYELKTRHSIGKLVIDSQARPTGFVKWRDDQLAVSTNEEIILFPLSLLHNRPKLAEPVTDIRPSFRLVFPFLRQDDFSLTGIAVSNLTDKEANLTFSAVDSLGETTQFRDNAVSAVLQPGTQWARLASEIFGGPVIYSWAEMASDNAEVSGFFMHRNGGGIDGATAFSHTSRTLYIPRVTRGINSFRGKTPSPILSIANPNGFQVEANLTLYATEISNLARFEKFVLPIQLRARSVTTFAMQNEVPGWNELTGHIKLEVTSPRGELAAYYQTEIRDQETLSSVETLIAANAIELPHATRFYSAQLASAGNIFTSLKLINVSNEPRHILLKAVGENGMPLAPPVQLDLAPDGSIEKDVQDLFAFPNGGGLIVGSLIVETDGEGIIGDVVFGDPQNLDYAASMPLQADLFRKAVFGHVANLDNFFTGLALFNPGTEPAQISLDVFSPNGESTGKTSFGLGPGQRTARLLMELVPSTAGQAGGYVVVTSSVPIVGQQLFGDSGLTMMSAVPPNILTGAP